MRAVPRILEAGLMCAVAVAVGGFGGANAIAWRITQGLILASGVLLMVKPPALQRMHWIPSLLGAWIAVQWFAAGRIASSQPQIGFDSYAIRTQALTFLTALVAFYLAAEIARDTAGAERLAISLVVLAAFEALYGLAQYLAGWQYIWAVRRRFYLGSATGTYINHNHFAGFIEMILPLALTLALYRGSLTPRRIGRDLPQRFSLGRGTADAMRGALLLLAAVLMVLAIIFSLSRMGLIAMLASLVLVAAVMLAVKHQQNRAMILAAFLAAAIAGAAWMGLGPVAQHLSLLPQDESVAQHAEAREGREGRAAIWQDTAKLIAAHPLTGVGLGSFRYAFTSMQSERLTYIADHAHNDFLELAAELGLPAAALLFTAVFWVAAKILRASLRPALTLGGALALGSVAGIFALLLHGAVDFNLYIPANALVFAVLLGLGYTMSRRQEAIPEPSPAVVLQDVSAMR